MSMAFQEPYSELVALTDEVEEGRAVGVFDVAVREV